MTTVAVSRPARPHAPAVYDRAFYSGMAILMAATVFAGFAPTFYLRDYFGAPVTVSGAASLSPLAQIHGAVFTCWVLLFLAQTTLIAGRWVKVHMRLGIVGVVLAAAMVALGVTTAIVAGTRGSAPPGIDPHTFLAIPLFDMVMFAGFMTAAVRMRRNKEAHKRLMLLAYVSIIVAAVARLPGMALLGPPGFFGVSFAFVLIGMAYDLATRRRIHPVYLWGGGLLFVSFPLRLVISGTGAWRTFAELLIG